MHKLLLVAFSTCSSRAVLAEDDHQLIILGKAPCVVVAADRGVGQKALS